MRTMTFFLTIIGGMFVAGIGVGLFVGWVSDDDPGSVWFPLVGALLFLAGGGAMYWGYRQKVASADSGGDASDIDMLLGDMSDPVQRNIILRVVVASAIHGMVLLNFIDRSSVPVTLGDGPLERPELITLGAFGLFLATLVWIVIECIRFHRIDEFWTRIAIGPAALAGVILFMAVTLWSLGEEVLGLGAARFWHFYLFYYVTIVALMIGKWQLGKRRGGI